jgi:hypothetical protein
MTAMMLSLAVSPGTWLTPFGVVDAVPVKTDEGGESHRTRHGTGRRLAAVVGRDHLR